MSRAALLLVVCVLAACKVGSSFEPPQGGLHRMIEQPRYDPFEESQFFDDGLTMRHPPEGTVPFTVGSASSSLETGIEDELEVSQIPLPMSAPLMQIGRERYDIVCATCHGLRGTGDAPVATNMQLRPPPSLVAAPVTGYSPGRLYRIITQGYGFMPGYSMMLSQTERWAIVAYLDALQLSQNASVDELPAGVRALLPEEAP